MQQRQYRPGDVLDDYCPRERRVTDHAIVAMVESEIQRTRCVVCDAEHEYKNARVPAPRKKASGAGLFTQVLDNIEAPPGRIAIPAPAEPAATAESAVPPGPAGSPPDDTAPPPEPPSEVVADDRPFRRSLIRAQLPRPEGQPAPTRAIPEFTMHQRRTRGGQGFRHGGGGWQANGNQRGGNGFNSRPGRSGHGHGQGQGNGPGPHRHESGGRSGRRHGPRNKRSR